MALVSYSSQVVLENGRVLADFLIYLYNLTCSFYCISWQLLFRGDTGLQDIADTMQQKKLSAAAARELKELQKASFEDSDGELGRRTEEDRGEVKESTTQVQSVAQKLDEQAKLAAEARKKQFQATRQIHTSKSGSKSAPEDLGPAVVLGVSDGPQASSSGTRHLPAESFKTAKKKEVHVGAGTPPRVQSEELSPRNLEKDMMNVNEFEEKGSQDAWWNGGGNQEEEEEDVKTMMKKMMKMMVTKEDLKVLKMEVKEVVKEEVKKEVDKVVGPLEERLSLVEHGGTVKGEGGTSKETEELWRFLDKTDPAKRKVAFKGFSDTVLEKTRLDELEKELAKLSVTTKPEAVYTGPKGQRKLTRVVLADFGSEKEAQDFVKKHKNSFPAVAGCSLEVCHARTELNTKRNTVLRKATEAVQQAVKDKGLATDTVVETKWGNDRQVTVNKEVVFVQNKTGVSGRFLGAYSTLTIP